MAYTPDNWTDKELEALEKRIAEVFKQAEKDLDKEVKEYFAKFVLRDKGLLFQNETHLDYIVLQYLFSDI